MVSKPKKENAAKKKKLKVLNLKKESVKDLTGKDAKGIKGGLVGLSLVGVRSQSGSVVRSRHTLASRD
jgi:hypothetical protein